MSIQSRIKCGYTWDEEGSVCLDSRNEGLGDSCHCNVLLPTDNVVKAADMEHDGPHMCKCGEIHGVDQTVETEITSEVFNRLRGIKSLLRMDPTRQEVVPVFQSGEFQTVMQTAILLDIAESLREIEWELKEMRG